jgi:hypothetical protein
MNPPISVSHLARWELIGAHHCTFGNLAQGIMHKYSTSRMFIDTSYSYGFPIRGIHTVGRPKGSEKHQSSEMMWTDEIL